MGTSFPVLVVDDGELEDIRDLVNGERVDFAHLRGSAVPDPLDPPRDLFITNPRHAELVARWEWSHRSSISVARSGRTRDPFEPPAITRSS